jgi:phosphohistidine swiveling domain-containing protein
METMTEQPPIAVRDPFDVEWATPEEAVRFWIADLMHWPNGISPLTATMDLPPFFRGLVKAAETLCMPFSAEAFGVKVVRGYVYNSFVPFSTDPAQMAARLGEMQAQMGKHVPGLIDRWHNEYEPEIRAINDETLRRDFSDVTDEELANVLEHVVEERERQGELHYLSVFPAGAAVMMFEQVYTSLFGEPHAGEHLLLLQGFPNKSVEVDTGLWRLAQEARKHPQVLSLLQDVDPAEVHDALMDSKEGREFRAAVEEFLDVYGWRGNELDIAAVTWKEDPSTAYKFVRDHAARDDHDPEAELRSLVTAREARERLLIDRLSDPEQIDLFRRALAGAQQYLPIEEDHNFWIDQQGTAAHRVPVMEAAKRLVAAGTIRAVDDVFLLEFEELLDGLRGRNGALHDRVEVRRREMEENRALTPPPTRGTPPPPGMPEDPMLAKFFGGPPPASADPRVFKGNGASAGRVTGTARVILSLDEAERLGAGEVLVCPSTMPPWTPLFASASAVVTDHGGVLSHTAIVAREYGIPAVVGTKVATALIRDGWTITVDGDEGTVTLEDV